MSPEIERDCRALTRRLVGREPSDYVLERFARGLRSPAFREGQRRSGADGVLEFLARMGPIGLSLADTWARFMAPAGPFRRRLVLLAAILESSPDTFTAFEPPPAGRVRAWLALTGTGLLFGLRLTATLVLVGPAHMVASLAGRTRRTGEESGP